MPPEYDLPHFDISDRVDTSTYKAHTPNRPSSATARIRQEHGQKLLDQLHAAFRASAAEITPREGVERAPGAYYEVDLTRGADAQSLDRKRASIKAGATRLDEGGRLTTVIYVPDDSIATLEQILEDYRSGPLTKKGNIPKAAFVEPIDEIRKARLQAFWTDPMADLPSAAMGQTWWEVWAHIGEENSVADGFRRLNCRVAEREQWLKFPELVVIPVLARLADIEVALFAIPGISELRRGSDTPAYFLDNERETQHEWVEELANRIVWPGLAVPRVCLLDTGVNRSHMLLEPALAGVDLMTVDPRWVPTDDRGWPHGTEMAGIALHGDLFIHLQDQSAVVLDHRLESVRIMPSDGFPPNEPARLGSITQSAVSLAEIQNPQHRRVFCMAITNKGLSGARPTSWSAAVDTAAVGLLAGDEVDRPRRLFFISAGNRNPDMDVANLKPLAQYPIDDPAQAWNAISVGGYTEKIHISEPTLKGYLPVAQAGDVSPFSRNSMAWPQGKSPFKPDIVMEAGNRARSPDGKTLYSCGSLELLTTGSEADRMPIVNFNATSAATALASRFGARLMSAQPDLWPETLRALMIHSADWTPPMKERLDAAGGQRDKIELIRQFGYGVPNFERAQWSALNDLAILIEQEIQPYERKAGGHIGFKECHYYPLPWPKSLLESHAYHDKLFELKIVLSYFIEPNPGRAAAIDPMKYQSYGLRFDLRRPQERLSQFKARINADELGDSASVGNDSGWVLGPRSVSAGSVHCDIWRGTGAQLASRDMICVKPVGGWWKERLTPAIHNRRGRYALVANLSAPDLDIDLYTPILNGVKTPISTEVDIGDPFDLF
jgi:hypothetical protein